MRAGQGPGNGKRAGWLMRDGVPEGGSPAPRGWGKGKDDAGCSRNPASVARQGLAHRSAGTARTRVVEENHVLRDDADCFPERPKFHLPHVAPVDADRAALHVEEAEEQAEEGGLPRARCAHHRARLPRLNPEGNVAEELAVGGVAEADTVKLDESADGRAERRRAGVRED
eukprot:scaffold5292_cov113-Isochrysis_galbana.AAC.6